MSNIPPELQNAFICNSLPNGRIQLVLVKDGQNTAIEIEAETAANVAAQLLATAKLSFDRSGLRPVDPTTTQTKFVEIEPSQVGLGPATKPGHESLMVRFGQATLAVTIETSKFQKLGEACLALSASKARPQ